MNKIRIYGKIKSSVVFRESSSMFIAEGIGVAFALLVVLFRSRYLSVTEVGIISFITSFISFFSGFFHLGLDSTGARLIIQEPDVTIKRRLAGTVFLVSFILAAIFGIFLAGITVALPFFGKGEVTKYIYLILPFAGYNVILCIYKQLCFGLGNIREASVQLCISYIVYFIALVAAQLLNILTLTYAVVASYAINMLTVLFPIILVYRHELHWDRSAWMRVKQEQKERGWKIYLSRVVFTSTSNLDTLIVGFFHPMDSVAFFSLTKYFSMPISMVGNSVSQSIYRKYGSSHKIGKETIRKVILATILIAAGVCLFAIAAVFIMGDEYRSMLAILPISMVTNVVASVNALYSSFMNAKGMADEIRNLALFGATTKVITYLALIIPFGALGGIIANLIVTIFIFVLRVYYCKQYEKRVPAVDGTR